MITAICRARWSPGCGPANANGIFAFCLSNAFKWPRVPDLCVVSRKQKLEAVFTEPPVICVEILSKQDTLQSLQDRIDDYRFFGVPNIWILNPDPAKPRAYVCILGGFREPEDGVLEVPGSPIRIPIKDLFSELS